MALKQHHVVIVGGGFGGLYAARELMKHVKDGSLAVTVIDRRNFHLFQPLLYQVAMGELSPADIAAPLRSMLTRHCNMEVLLGEVSNIDIAGKKVVFAEDGIGQREVPYDSLILATGSSHFYFGKDDKWASMAPGLKSVENALDIRARVFSAFEAAEREPDPERRQAWMTFAIVGAGPTGVELAGALAELAREVMSKDFCHIDCRNARILLIEGMDRVLPPYPPALSAKAHESLKELGIEVCLKTLVTEMAPGKITMSRKVSDDQTETNELRVETVLWAAGVKASPLGKAVAEQTSVETDRAGKVPVEADCSVPGHPDVFIVGDLASYAHTKDGKPLPGVAPVAMQMGTYVAKRLWHRIKANAANQQDTYPAFSYKNRGSLAVIGRNRAVADLQNNNFSGFVAWFMWMFIHIFFLIGFENKVRVFLQWLWSYFWRKKGARLITHCHTPEDAKTPAG